MQRCFEKLKASIKVKVIINNDTNANSAFSCYKFKYDVV